MRHLLVALCLMLLAALSSCEEVAPADDVQYVNKIVVEGVLTAGVPVDSIYVGHTLPLTTPYDISKSVVSDAKVTISADGNQYPLEVGPYGLYRAPNLIPEVGKTYTLEVTWQGMTAHASTQIPQPIVIDSTTYTNFITRDTLFGIDTVIVDTFREVIPNFQPIGDEVYDLAFYVKDVSDSWVRVYGGTEILRRSDTNQLGSISRPMLLFTLSGRTDSGSWKYVVESYPRQYYDFYNSYHSYSGDDPFSSGGANPIWNVTGDGIGLFTGRARTEEYFH